MTVLLQQLHGWLLPPLADTVSMSYPCPPTISLAPAVCLVPQAVSIEDQTVLHQSRGRNMPVMVGNREKQGCPFWEHLLVSAYKHAIRPNPDFHYNARVLGIYFVKNQKCSIFSNYILWRFKMGLLELHWNANCLKSQNHNCFKLLKLPQEFLHPNLQFHLLNSNQA